jgi:hypothetical protein
MKPSQKIRNGHKNLPNLRRHCERSEAIQGMMNLSQKTITILNFNILRKNVPIHSTVPWIASLRSQ